MNPFEKHKIEHLSPSSLNLYAEQPAAWALKYLHGFREEAPRMWRGSAVEAGLDQWLYKREEGEALSAAFDRFDLDAQGEVTEDIDRELARIPPMLEQAIEAMADLGPPTLRQHPVEVWFDDIEVPVFGIIDYEWEDWGCDLKSTARMPSQVYGGHARQVSLYSLARSKPYKLLYVTEKKWAWREIEAEEVKAHIKRLEWYAHSIRRVLSMFSDPVELAKIFPVNYDHPYLWKTEASREAAARIWE